MEYAQAAGSTGIQYKTATEAAVQQPIPQAAQQASQALEDLHARLQTLESKLEPYMRGSSPKPISGNSNQAIPAQVNGHFHERLLGLRTQVMIANDRVIDILERLAI